MKPLVIGGVVAAAALVLIVVASGNEEKARLEQQVAEDNIMEQQKMEMEKSAATKLEMEKDTAMVDGEDAMMKTEVPAGAMIKGSYSTYSADKLAMANNGKVVLFFKASWCPSCRALDADIKANVENIPDGVAILEVDYDSSSDLKKKYGVTMQHTLVQVDADGNLINKWSGGATLSTVAANIK